MAKVLGFTDPHGSTESARAIVALALRERPDLVVCPDDISFFGSGHGKFLDILAALKQDVLFVSGNHDSGSGWDFIATRYPFLKDVSYRTFETAGVRVGGVPGTDTALRPGTEEVEEDHGLPMNLWGGIDRSKPLVLLCDYPPSGTNVSGAGLPAGGGARVVRLAIKLLQPSLIVTGHYRSVLRKEDHIGRSRIVNPGSDGMILET